MSIGFVTNIYHEENVYEIHNTSCFTSINRSRSPSPACDLPHTLPAIVVESAEVIKDTTPNSDLAPLAIGLAPDLPIAPIASRFMRTEQASPGVFRPHLPSRMSMRPVAREVVPDPAVHSSVLEPAMHSAVFPQSTVPVPVAPCAAPEPVALSAAPEYQHTLRKYGFVPGT